MGCTGTRHILAVLGKPMFTVHAAADRTAVRRRGTEASHPFSSLAKPCSQNIRPQRGCTGYRKDSSQAFTSRTIVPISHKAMLTGHSALDRAALTTGTDLTAILSSQEAILTIHEAHGAHLGLTLGRLDAHAHVTAIVVLLEPVLTVHEAVDGEHLGPPNTHRSHSHSCPS